jgi:BioD-like phosphotransacetylase family protein
MNNNNELLRDFRYKSKLEPIEPMKETLDSILNAGKDLNPRMVDGNLVITRQVLSRYK